MKGKKQINISTLNEILKTTIDSIKSSKDEIFEIVTYSRHECKRLEEELGTLKQGLLDKILEVDRIEKLNKKHREALANKSKNFDVYSEKQVQEAYNFANETRIILMLKMEEEKNLREKRDELEIRLKNSYELYHKAENINKQITVATEYLMGNSGNICETVDQLTQKHNLGIKIIEAQEEERLRVSRDMHDGPAQSLANVILKAEWCEKLLDVDRERAKEEIGSLKGTVKDTLKDVRKIIYDLRPMSLDDLGLVPTLERYIDVFKEETKININLKFIGSFNGLESAIQIVAFRVIQESLNNIRNHAQATSVQVIVEKSLRKLNISISDDGIGFNVDEYKPGYNNISSGFGIISIKERVELLNGDFNIVSSLNYGTKVNISIPLDKEVE